MTTTAVRPGEAAASAVRVFEPASRRVRAAGYALLALVAYAPPLMTARHRIAADTKTYLYLDPSRLMERAVSMWDPHIGMGTVTHQNIGYLFPMGPFYWVFERLGFPDWFAQRMWMGSLVFFAGLGMFFLFRTLGVRGPGVVVGSLAFMFSPYVLDYAARISVILLPWAGLPWMLAFVVRGLREGGWRYPALFAITVQIVGGVNATALLFAGLAPALYFPYAVWWTREVDWRRALATAARIGVLTVAASLWWISGLWAQGRYGLDILAYTETVKAVARTSTAPEVLRGLGYWFFYGGDKLGPWIEANLDYTHFWPRIAVGYGLACLSLAAAGLLRWRLRAYFVLLALLGVTIAVGVYPFSSPSPFGRLVRDFARSSQAGMALRSTARAVPLVVMSLAVLLAVGINAGVRWVEAHRADRVRWARVAVFGVGFLVLFNFPALWNGTYYGKNLQRPELVPTYWDEAAAYLDARPHDTRVLALPGSDFASYYWGNTVDPILPGIMDRPFVARELIPYGSPASANLLNAFDRQIQEGVGDPASFAPVSRLMAVGDILLRNDIQTARYNLIRPQPFWMLFHPDTPPGLGAPREWGPIWRPGGDFPLIDEQTLQLPPGTPFPPSLVAFPVESPRPIVRAGPSSGAVTLAGDGDGIVNAASVGLIGGSGPVFYSADAAGDREALRRRIGQSSTLVVTDTNRRRAQRWSGVRDTMGYTEQAGEEPLVYDASDARLPVFPGAGDDTRTVTIQNGVESVRATAYGNPVAYTPEDRAARAFDGDLYTAWKVGAFANVRNDRIVASLRAPITTDRVRLWQVQHGPVDRWMTKVTLRFDGGSPVVARLRKASRYPSGQVVRFPRRTFRELSITINDTNFGQHRHYGSTSAVGLAEIDLRDDRPGARPVRVDEVVRMPTDLLDAAGAAASSKRLVFLIDRQRVSPYPPRYDPELRIARELELPSRRSFILRGAVRINADSDADGEITDRALHDELPGGIASSAEEHIAGDVGARASSAIDGDPSTAFVTTFALKRGRVWVRYRLPEPVTFDRMDMQVVADGRHSVPTRLRVTVDGGRSVDVDVPPIADGKAQGHVVPVTVRLPRLTGREIEIRFLDFRKVTTVEYFSTADVAMPIAIAEWGIPGVRVPPLPAEISRRCRDDLVTLDGKPLAVRIVGTTEQAVARRPLSLEPCGGALDLGPGRHVIRSAQGRRTGFDVDRLVLASDAGGAPMAGLGPTGEVPADPAAARGASVGTPRVEVEARGDTDVRVRVRGASEPFWLVLGQSRNDGWRARVVDGRTLGSSTLVDGYANGWLVDPAGRSDFAVQLTWAPQRVVRAALFASAAAMLVCLLIVAGSLLRRRPRPAAWVAADGGELVDPRVASGGTPSTARAVGAAVLVGAASGFIAGPLVGLAVGTLVLVVVRAPHRRMILSLGAAASLAVAGGYTTLKQAVLGYPSVFEWPTFFSEMHVAGWFAILFITADVVVELVRRGRPRPGGGP